jgi:hypothetical protein
MDSLAVSIHTVIGSQVENLSYESRCSDNTARTSPLSRIHIPPRPNLWPPHHALLVTRQYRRQVIRVHDIQSLLSPALDDLPRKLLLILGQYQPVAPAALASALHALRVRGPRDRLGHVEPVTAVVPLHVGLKVQAELTARVGRAGDAGQGWAAAAGAELLGEVAHLREAGWRGLVFAVCTGV